MTIDFRYAIVLSVPVIALLILALQITGSPQQTTTKIRGVCWVGGDSVAAHNILELQSHHVDWISQTPFGWQQGHDSPEIHFEESGWYWGEREAGLAHTDSLADEHGIKTVLKPHIWLRRSSGKWRSDIEMTSQEDWNEWFSNYRSFILYYAEIAAANQIEMLCIGTELYHPSTRFPDKWRALVSEIREIYPGKLTYAANFYKEYSEITWWDAVDYIGIQGYFPLSEKSSPGLSDLKRGWSPHLAEMARVSKAFDRQVLFTELGYRNDGKAASEPWLWPSQIDLETTELDEGLQADCYRAFFDRCWTQDWLAGVFFWKWHHSSWKFETRADYISRRQKRIDSLVAIGKANPRNISLRQIHFSPQGMEAVEVLTKNFEQSASTVNSRRRLP